MTLRYLLDTDICSYLIKGGYPALDQRLQATAPGDIAISAITRAELRYGLALRPEATRLQQLVETFLRFVATLSWDAATADCYGLLRATLHRTGQPIGDHDTMIAAQALAANLILVTHNLAHFNRINGLKCEDWV
ncbi:MAG: type II toxin-antitoxin system VapC family toxin [Phycisphaerales bacterium]|nr:type II toxin-antitoxin system VapC family toxin [Phycisphaerales bacterium]